MWRGRIYMLSGGVVQQAPPPIISKNKAIFGPKIKLEGPIDKIHKICKHFSNLQKSSLSIFAKLTKFWVVQGQKYFLKTFFYRRFPPLIGLILNSNPILTFETEIAFFLLKPCFLMSLFLDCCRVNMLAAEPACGDCRYGSVILIIYYQRKYAEWVHYYTIFFFVLFTKE